jgi:protein JSN1
MSLSANDQAPYPKTSSGKTPPPAPSAAYAKRSAFFSSLSSPPSSHMCIQKSAREIQAEEGLAAGTGHYRPPALRVLAQGGSPSGETPPNTSVAGPRENDHVLPPTNFPQNFRRARAGTLPSNVSLAAQHFASTLESTPDSPSYDTDSFSQTSSPAATSPTTRPGLRHSASIASASAVTERNSRLRSGSLTLLPTGGLSNAFGPSIFSSSWLTNPRSGNISTLDEIRSTTSLDSGVGDEFDVHTLDYLGLDDGGRPPPPATVSELRNQAQAAIAGSLANPSRIRANTVSNPYRNRTTGPMLPPTHSEDESEEQYDSPQPADYDASLAQSTGFFPQSLINKGFKQASHLAAARPRAVSVANLDDAARNSPARRSTADSNTFGDVTASPTALAPAANIITSGQPTLRTDKLHISRSAVSPTIRFPNGERAFLSPGGVFSGRAVSPKTENASGQIQTPSRSLWIGNLDSTMSSDALIHVFAPYGAIESLRLLPEKVSKSDRYVRLRED